MEEFGETLQNKQLIAESLLLQAFDAQTVEERIKALKLVAQNFWLKSISFMFIFNDGYYTRVIMFNCF